MIWDEDSNEMIWEHGREATERVVGLFQTDLMLDTKSCIFPIALTFISKNNFICKILFIRIKHHILQNFLKYYSSIFKAILLLAEHTHTFILFLLPIPIFLYNSVKIIKTLEPFQ